MKRFIFCINYRPDMQALWQFVISQKWAADQYRFNIHKDDLACIVLKIIPRNSES